MKIKNRFKKAVTALMLVTMTAISVCACADKSGSDKAGEPGAVQGTVSYTHLTLPTKA